MKDLSVMTSDERNVYWDGFRTGQEIASQNIGELFYDGEGWLVEIEMMDTRPWEEAIAILSEFEEEARQFSPFEFYAKSINDREDASELWDAYDSGVSEGILYVLESEKQARE